jgi:hypothetical protein
MELNDLTEFCESPIEVSLLLALAAAFADFDVANMKLQAMVPSSYERFSRFPTDEASAYLIPQAVVAGVDDRGEWSYRIDFLLVCGSRPAFRRCFAIECDGHEWHEKTKQQVARDKRRDRRLIMSDIVPIRFSGSEIHKGAADCADYIRQLAHGALGDVLQREHDVDSRWGRV